MSTPANSIYLRRHPLRYSTLSTASSVSAKARLTEHGSTPIATPSLSQVRSISDDVRSFHYSETTRDDTDGGQEVNETTYRPGAYRIRSAGTQWRSYDDTSRVSAGQGDSATSPCSTVATKNTITGDDRQIECTTQTKTIGDRAYFSTGTALAFRRSRPISVKKKFLSSTASAKGSWVTISSARAVMGSCVSTKSSSESVAYVKRFGTDTFTRTSSGAISPIRGALGAVLNEKYSAGAVISGTDNSFPTVRSNSSTAIIPSEKTIRFPVIRGSGGLASQPTVLKSACAMDADVQRELKDFMAQLDKLSETREELHKAIEDLTKLKRVILRSLLDADSREQETLMIAIQGADTFTPQDLASTSVCYLASNRYEDASKEAVMATESMASWILVSHALFVVVIFLLLWLV
ncbi:uncharacterized protein LOC111266154 [Varroa jacobsoni]|uniref:uncharacterized protein LOC111266154 n=1 Tax=Varroa jacobsoni TaxID=62625 RepID=UPI000BF49E9F|nr:uncharacterized protein LOC111266154 [Varroa jacobsoni]